MAFALFTPLFGKVDTAVATFVTDISSRAIAEATPFATVGLSISFIWFSVMIMLGKHDMPVADFITKSLRSLVILAFATSGGIYQTQIADAIRTLPDDMATALISGPGTSTAASVIDTAAEQGFKKAGDAFEKGGFLSSDGLIFGLFGIIILIVTSVLTAFGGALIMVSKIVLGLLAGVGPLFVFALLFDPLKKLFESWSAQVLTYTLLTVFVSAIFGFVVTTYGTYMSNLTFEGGQNIAYALGGAVIMGFVFIVILLRMPELAGAVSGGVGMGGLIQSMKGAMTGAKDAVGKSEKRDSQGRLEQKAGGMIGAGQSLGRAGSAAHGGAQRAFSYARGRMGAR